MRYEIYNGQYVGTVEWSQPGRVRLDVEDRAQRRWLERYFAAEDSFLAGSVACPEMMTERRDASEQAFARAAYALVAYSYNVRDPESNGSAGSFAPFAHSVRDPDTNGSAPRRHASTLEGG